MNLFKRLVILDPILISQQQWSRLRKTSEVIVQASSAGTSELMQALNQEQERDARPMCWTQLAQEDISRERLGELLSGADAVISCWTNIPDDVLMASPALKYIGFWTNIVSHRVNLEAARTLGVYVTYLPDYGTDSVAEMTMAGMLAVSRKVMRSAKDTERGRWPYELLKTGVHVPTIEDIPNRMLRDKLLGIVGFGRIGQRVAELAQAFRMRLQYYSRHRYADWEAKGARYVGLPELFSSSDIVSVHLSPYAPEKVISADLLGRLKDDAIFVNTSAGRLVDQEALFQEIERKRIFAYLDVYEGLPPRYRFRTVSLQDNLFTYRTGWFTQEAITYKGEALLRNIEAFLAGKVAPAAWDTVSAREDRGEVQCSGGARDD
jgi:glycerate dehydrogenase